MLRFALSDKTFTYTVVLELSLQQKGTHNICTGHLDRTYASTQLLPNVVTFRGKKGENGNPFGDNAA